jgi:hypothetical protein
MVEAEHHNGQALVLAVGCQAQAPPYVDWVEDDERDVVLVKLLGHHAAGVRLSSAALGKDGEGFCGRIYRELN